MYLRSSCDDNCWCEFVDVAFVDMREEDWRGISLLSESSLLVSDDCVAIDFVADDGGMPRRRRNAGGHEVPPDALQPLPLLPDDNDDIIADFPIVCRAHSFVPLMVGAARGEGRGQLGRPTDMFRYEALGTARNE